MKSLRESIFDIEDEVNFYPDLFDNLHIEEVKYGKCFLEVENSGEDTRMDFINRWEEIKEFKEDYNIRVFVVKGNNNSTIRVRGGIDFEGLRISVPGTLEYEIGSPVNKNLTINAHHLEILDSIRMTPAQRRKIVFDNCTFLSDSMYVVSRYVMNYYNCHLETSDYSHGGSLLKGEEFIKKCLAGEYGALSTEELCRELGIPECKGLKSISLNKFGDLIEFIKNGGRGADFFVGDWGCKVMGSKRLLELAKKR